MKKAIVAIASEMENPYIAEWVNYHLQLGFDQIYIYVNFNGRFDITDERVKQIPWLGVAQQLSAYNDFLANKSSDVDWAAFIDIDEFVVIKNISLDELLEQHKYEFALCLNWKLFGSSGLKEVINDNYSVLDRFHRCQNGVNPHIKTIVNLKKARGFNGMMKLLKFINPHFTNFSCQYGFAYSPENRQVEGAYNPNGSDDIAFLAHYITKSQEECRVRRSHIRADIPSIREEGWEEFFTAHDKNECEMNILEYM